MNVDTIFPRVVVELLQLTIYFQFVETAIGVCQTNTLLQSGWSLIANRVGGHDLRTG
jgi:hypothetical protein